jgi:outer membrane protein
MKNILRTIFPAVLLLTVLGGSALAQTKIATVDMKKLFDNYYKTKEAQAAIEDRETQLAKDDDSMKADLKAKSDEYQQLLQEANDMALSEAERDKHKQESDDKLKVLQASQAALEDYERQAQVTLSDQRSRMHDKIMDAINASVASVAKAGGYNIVLNTATVGMNLGTTDISFPSPVVYSSSEIDLTDVVLKQLNIGAPLNIIPTAPSSPIPASAAGNGP